MENINDFLPYIKGFVRLRLSSREPERFLNLCAHHRIRIWDLLCRGDHYELCMSVSDFRRLRTLCRKTFTKVKIIERRGLPFFLYRNRKRKAFFIGIFLCLSLIFGLSQFVWSIEFEGNQANTDQVILRFLRGQGIRCGIPKAALNCADISASIRQKFANIIWVSTKKQGTRLIVEVKESRDPEAPSHKEVTGPEDLVAGHDGVIVRMVTRAGLPQVQKGQLVKAGDVLVRGRVEIYDDSGTLVRTQLVRPDADVYIRHAYDYYDAFPLRHRVRVYEEKPKKRLCIRIGSTQLDFGFHLKGRNTEKTVQTSQLAISRDFLLPFYWDICEEQAYVYRMAMYGKSDAKALSTEHFIKFQKELSENGVQILYNHVKIGYSNTSCVTKGEVVVIERCGKLQTAVTADTPAGKEPAEE